MSAGIMEYDVIEGTRQFWHNQAIVREDLALSNCILTKSDIERVPVYMMDKDGNPVALEGQSIIRCTDTGHVIGKSITDSYQPLTNARYLELVAAAVEGVAGKIVSVGTVRNRARRFVSFEFDALNAIVTGGREFTAYISFLDSLDQSSLLLAPTTETCTVCDNTFEVNRLAATANRAKHTKNIETKLDAMADIIQQAALGREQFHKDLAVFHLMPCDKDTATRFFAGFVGVGDSLSTRASNNTEHLVSLFQRGAGNRGETWLDLFQAGTDAWSHEFAKSANAMAQFESSEFGAGRDAKRRLFDTIQDADKRNATIELGKALIEGRTNKLAAVVA